eukprot:3859202-Alexandrium_andersonii.AAC.1
MTRERCLAWQPGTLKLPLKPLALAAPSPWQISPAPLVESPPGSFAFRWAGGCGTTYHAAEKPSRGFSGWPKWWCPSCKGYRRLSKAQC